MQISKLTSKTWSTFSGFGGRAGGNTPTHVKPATTRQHPYNVPTNDRTMNTTGKDINASPTRTDTDHTQKRLILRFTRKTKQFVAFGLLLLASALTTPVAAQTTVSICDRTDEVEAAILAAIPSPPACSAVTATQLAAITSLNLASMSITTLQSGDFADLSILARLFLSFNGLTTLPADLFSGLTSLTTLSLNGNNLSALPDGLFSGLTSLTDLRLQGNTFTTPLPGDIFVNLPSDATIQIDLSPIGDLTGVALTVGGMPTINVANAFISRDGLGNDRTLSYTLTPANTAVATVSLSGGGVATITGAGMGTTTVSVLANDGVSGAVGMLTRDIAVTVVGTGILAFDAATGNTIATPIVAEASGTDTFYVQLASAPASDVTLTLTSSDTSEGTVMPGTLTFTAAAGTTSWDTRQAVTVTAVDDNVDRDDTFTVGFAIATVADGDGGDYTNSLTIPGVTVTVTDDDVAASICSRTMQVQTVILAAIPGSLACDAVIESQLAAITGVLFLDSMGLTTLLPGDLAGLSGITTLFLDDNDLTTLPSGIFSDLGSLSILSLDGSGLATLPAGVFDGLTSLNNLNLEDNALTALPAGLFDGLTSLTELNLTRNALTTLPANAFSSDLTSVATLFLNDNALTTIDTNAFSGLTSLITLDLSNNMLTALPDGAFTGFTSLASLRLNSNTFTTPLPATLFDSLPDSAGIRIDLSPIGDLADIPSLTLGGVATINVAEAFISGDATGNPRTITYTITPTGTSVASATADAAGVLTITASDTITGVTTIDIVADDSVSSTVTRNIAVTVVEVGLAFFEEVDSATGSTEVTSITTGEPDVAATFYVELISAPTADVTVTVMSDDTTEGMITTGASLTFTTGNWNIRQSVTVTGQDDNLIDVDTSYNITLASTSSDTNYNALTETLSATNTDDDVVVDICPRTDAVETAILMAISTTSPPACDAVTESQLAAITGTLDLSNMSIASLQAGDFAGLSGLIVLNLSSNTLTDPTALPAGVFNGLTNLILLNLSRNSLSTLPAGLFDSLTNLTTLNLTLNSLSTALPADIFDNLTSLTSLNLSNNMLTALPAGVFDELTGLTSLELNSNNLSALPMGVFDNLTSLTQLFLNNNMLTALPDDALFTGLTSLNFLRLQGNTFTTALPANIFAPVSSATIQIDLSPIGDLDDIPSLTLGGVTTINVANAFISRTSAGTDRALSYTITPTGTSVASATESSGVLTITASDTITGVTTIDIVADDTESSTVTRNIAVTVADVVNICSRTMAVQTAILAAIPTTMPATTCSTVTGSQLAAITGSLNLSSMSISALLPGDFADLSGLTSLFLDGNDLSTLPAGIFNPLTALTSLDLSFNSLTMLPSGIFSTLTNLTALVLWDNSSLGTLESDVFSALTNLTRLDLQNTGLSALPAGLFTGLTNLTELRLHDNAFTTPLPANLFDPVPSAVITIDLSPIGDLADIVLTFGTTTMINVADAFISRDLLGNDRNLSFTITPTGTSVTSATESSGVLTITASGTIAGVTNVDIVADDDSGGANADLTRTIAVTVDTVVDICSRTAAVQTAILETISLTSPPACDAVTEGQLAAVAFLNLGDMSITALQSGDFADLSGLTLLVLSNNSLGTLPSGIFSGLTNLGSLFLSDSDLSALEPDVFSGLTSLTGLALSGNSLTSLPDGLFDNLTNLTSLELADNDLTALEVGIFDPLTSLTNLDLFDNDLTALPANLFDRLTSLTALSLEDNTFTTPLPADIFDPLPSDAVISIDLSPIGDLTDVALTLGDTTTINVANAFISRNVGGDDRPLSFTTALTGTSVTSVTEDAGVLTITASDTMIGMTSVEITASDSTGGTTGMSARTISVTVTEPAVNICDRTTMVETAILAAIPATNDCTAVTSTQLSDIMGTLDLNFDGIRTLQVGDFAGLSGVTSLDLSSNFISATNALPAGVFTGLTSLTELNLGNHRFLTALQAGVFDGLTNLEILNLNQLAALTALPANIFDNLTNLTELNLSEGGLTTLPANIFDNLTNLTELNLRSSALTTLPAGVFDNLTSLTRLDLVDNNLTALPAGIFDNLTSLSELFLNDNSLITLPAGLFDNLTSLTSLGLTGNPFTTALPANLFDSISSINIRTDLSPIGELPGVALTTSGTTTVNVTNAFISRNGGFNRTISFSEMSNDTTVATAMESSGVVTITGVGMGTTTVSVTADDGRDGTVSMRTRDIAVTVVETGILAFDGTTGNTLATPIAAEASGTDTFYVQLASAPANDVTLTLTSSDTNEGTVSPLTLTFTAAAGATSWDTRRLVTVTAVDDGIVRDDSFTVNFAVTTGDGVGGTYPTSLTLPSVTVNITDDDTVGIGAYDMLMDGSEISTITTSETGAGNVATFYVALTSQPTGTVTVTISGLDAGEHTLTAPASGTLTFTTMNWNTRQPITLTGVDDSDVDGDQTYDITLTATGGGYDGVVETGSATNTDDDTAMISIADMSVDEDAGTVTVTVTLSAMVTVGDVTVNAMTIDGTATAGTDYTAITSQTLTFTVGSTTQTLDITISDDSIGEGDEAFTVMLDTLVQPTGVTTVSITDATAEVTITDDETVPTTIGLEVSPSTIAETADATEIIVTATLGDGSASLPTDTVVTLTISGTATGGGTDYTLTMPISTINIAALATSATKTFMIDPIDDSTTEGEETVIISGTAGSFTVNSDTLTILEAGVLVFDATTGDTAPDVVAAEGGGMDTFYVRLASAPARDVTLTLTSSDTNEGTVLPATLTFTAAAGTTSWDTRQLVTVTAVPDDIDRDDTFTVDFEIATAGDGDGANYTDSLIIPSVTVTVTDDDTVGFTVDIGDGVTTSEGSATPDTFSVVLNSEPTDTVTITISGLVTTEHSLTPSTTLMFTTTNWDTAQTVMLNSVDDNVVDGDQMYDLTLTPSGGGYDSVMAQTVSITNTDTDTAVLTIADATVNENAGTATVTVTLTPAVTAGNVEVNANTVETTATAGVDYTHTNQALTFVAGTTSQTLDIPINDDGIVEGDEIFRVRLSALMTIPPGITAVSITDATAIVTITDDDVPGLTVDIGGGVSTSETGTGTTDTFTVVLNTQPTADVTVEISGLDAGEHSLTPSTTLMFTTTNWSTAQTVTLRSVDDNVVDGDQTYTITLTSTSTDTNYNALTQTVSVTNSDTDTAVLTIADMSVDEDAGTVTVTVTLSAMVTVGDVTVNAMTIDGTATAGTDYTAITSQTLTFTVGSTTQTLDITISDDSIGEGDEAFTVMLDTLVQPTGVTTVSITDATAEVTITDDETVPTTIGLEVSPSTIAETADATEIIVTATLGDGSASLPTDTVVTLTISGTATGGGTDYTLTMPISTINIAALATSATKTFMIDPIDDSTTEGEETVIISGTAGSFTVNSDTLTILEAGVLVFDATTGDTAPDVVAAEGGGMDTFYVRLASAPARDVTLTLTSSDTNEGTVLPATLTFTAAAGTTSWDTRQLVTVTAVPDDIDRDDTFTVDFEIATAGDGDGANYTDSLIIPSVTVTVTDDDTVGFTVDIGDGVTTSEGSATPDTFSVVLNSEPTDTVTITISGLVTTEHSLTPSTTLMFTTTNWDTAQTVMLTGENDDDVDGDQTYSLTLTPTGGGYTGVAVQMVSVTNTDTDTAELTIADMSVNEDAGTATVTVTLTPAVTAGTVTVNAMTVDGTATGADYTAITSQTLTFTAGSTTQTLDITINDDSIAEGNEAFTVMLDTLVQPTGVTTVSITDATAEVTIIDDDVPGLAVDIGDGVTTSEGSTTSDTFSVVLNTQPTADVTVTISGLDAGEHSLTPSTTLMFTTTNWSTAQTVTLNSVDDNVVDGDQTYDLTLTASGGDYTGVVAQTVSITNTDDDTAMVTIADTSVGEGAGTATVTVTLTPAVTAGDVMVDLTTMDGTATAGEDYTAITSQTLTITAGTISQTLDITINDDLVDEGDSETFTVMLGGLSAPTGVTIATDDTATVTITDDDTASDTIDLSVNPSTIAETASATTITVTATLDGTAVLPTPTVVTVSVGESGDSAVEGTDYATVADFTLTIPALSSSGMTTFMIDPNEVSTNGDMVTIDGTSGSFTFNPTTLTIVEAGILVFDAATGNTAPDVVAAENGGTDTFYVELASQPAGNVTLSAESNDTNEGTVTPATLMFTTTNWDARQLVTVTAVDDNIVRDDSFMVNFAVMSGTGNYDPMTLTTLPSVTVTVTDDDTASTMINLSISPDSIQETAGETTITVTATLNNDAFATEDTEVTLTISGTATINTDYTLTMPSSTITITALATSGTKTFMIDPVADNMSETPDETVIISGTATINGNLVTATATLTITEFSERDQQAIEQTVAAQASGVTQVVTEQIGIRLVSRASTSSGSGGSTQDRQSLSSIDWQDDLAKFTYEGLKRLDSEAGMSLDWLLQAAGGNGQVVMPLGAESLTLWATGGRISTKGDGVADYDGDVNSFILGIDTDLANDWLAGIAVSYNDSEVDYTMDGTPEAETEQTLYGIHPYLSRTVSKGLTLWATGGYGFGDVDFSRTGAGQATSDITQWMAAGGLEQQIITNTPWQGALRIKGLWGNAEVDAARYSGGGSIAKVDTDFWRARMESEMGYNFSLPGGNVRPYAIIGGRWDHNDAIVSGDEWHVDVGGGVELSDNAFALNISVRTQVTDGDTEEDSIFATGSVTYDLEQDGRGLQIALSRPLNNTSPAWDSHSFSALTDTASGLSGAPLTSELAYGWTVHPFGLKGALQTYVQNSFDNDDRHYAVGLELAVNALTLSFETGYHDHTSLNSGETDNTGLESLFKTKIRW